MELGVEVEVEAVVEAVMEAVVEVEVEVGAGARAGAGAVAAHVEHAQCAGRRHELREGQAALSGRAAAAQREAVEARHR